MASIRKRNGKYQVQIRINGYHKSKTFPCHILAKKWANSQELIAFTNPGDRPKYMPKNFNEILLKYWAFAEHHHKGAGTEEFVINALMREPWAQKPLQELTRSDIIAFRDKRLLSIKPSTFKRQMNIIRSAARKASEEWNWFCTVGLFEHIKLPKQDEHLVRRITPEIEKKLLSAARQLRNPLMAPLIEFALDTGMRRSELLALTIKDLDPSGELVAISGTKNGRSRVMPLSQRNKDFISTIGTDDDQKLFPMSPTSTRQAFERIRRRAECTWVRFHDLRHEAISRWFDTGLTVIEVQALSGHLRAEQALSYGHPNKERLFARLSGLSQAQQLHQK